MEDSELIHGCINNDRYCQQIFYKKYYGTLLAIIRRYMKNDDYAKDLLHDIFLKIFKNLHKYGNKGSLEGWVKRMTANYVIDHIRNNQKNKFIILNSDLADNLYSKAANYAEPAAEELPRYIEKISAPNLIKAISELTDGYRVVFNMYAVDGFTHKEISEKLSISIGTSKSNYAKAKKNLIRNLSQYL